MAKQGNAKIVEVINSKVFQTVILSLLVLIEVVVFFRVTTITLGIVQIMMMATTGVTTGYLLVFLAFVALQITFLIWSIRQLVLFIKRKN
ncbi:hypothetical protein [Paucilactobacillus kaifaensis]|uniref:hypothetical protein n=1 Tax=Paucilactobacillus kaifaensis TaxID=2559921 RepID=UPI0010F61637|nr:hypothetical protein [Paucilactobacillus kaifaensis]